MSVFLKKTSLFFHIIYPIADYILACRENWARASEGNIFLNLAAPVWSFGFEYLAMNHRRQPTINSELLAFGEITYKEQVF